MWFWPKLQLTDYERKFVSLYKEDNKPGVSRHSYRMQLASTAQPARGIPAAKLTDQIQISRRARIFALTFTGNTDRFRLQVRNSNGLQYTQPSQRTQGYPVVSSLIVGSYYNALASGGIVPPILPNERSVGVGPNPNFALDHMNGVQNLPWIIEPNWVCQPNETIIVQADVIPMSHALVPLGPDQEPGDYATTLPAVLNIVIFAWEFPGMGAV